MNRKLFLLVIALAALALPLGLVGAQAESAAPAHVRIDPNNAGQGYLDDVHFLPDGRIAVLYRVYYPFEQPGIYVQMFDADGALLGAPIQVVDYFTSAQMAVDAAGNFVVVWNRYDWDTYKYDLFGRRFSAAGAPLGDVFQISTLSDEAGYFRVAMRPNGSFIVFRTVYAPGVTDGNDIWLRVYAANGTPLTAELVAHAQTAGYQTIEEVVALGDGYLAVWQESPESGVVNLAGRRFNAMGQPLGAAFRLDAPGPVNETSVTIAPTPGGFVAVWEAWDQESVGNDQLNVALRAFDANGNPLGPERLINEYRLNTQRFPSIARVGDRYLVAWESDNRIEEMIGIYGRWVDAAGQPLGHEFPLSNCWGGVNYYGGSFAPQVVGTSAGDWAAIWTGAYTDACDPNNGGESHVYGQFAPLPADPLAVRFISASASGRAGNLRFRNSDVVRYMPRTNQWALMFDASNYGITVNLRDFALQPDGSMLLAFAAPQNGVEDVGSISPNNVYRFTPEYHYFWYGQTYGHDDELSLYFEGADAGLTGAAERIDAVATDWDGNLLISTVGAVNVPGLSAGREDLLKFSPTSLGANTAGAWSQAFDGSRYGITANLNAVYDDPQSASLFMTFQTGVKVTGKVEAPNTVLRCDREGGACVWSVYWRAAKSGLPASWKVDGLELPNGRQ